MTEPLKDEFDGTWKFANEKEEDGWNYLHFSNGNRIVQFYNIKNGGREFEEGRMLVGESGDGKIQFFPRGGGEGWSRGYRFDDGNLVIVEGEAEFPCSRLGELPEWLKNGIAAAELFFDEHEDSWDSA